MNKFLCLILLLTFSVNSQTKITQTEKHKQIGLVWGILKYHHPYISQGLYNWDSELINLLETIEDVDEQEKLNIELLIFLKKFKEPKNTFKIKPIKIDSEKIFKKNYDYNWIDEIAFGSKLRDELIKLKDNNNIGDYYALLIS